MQRRLDLSVGDPPGHQQHQHVVIWQLSCAVAAVGDMQVQHPPLRVQQIQSGGHGTSHSRIATALPAPGLRSPLMRDAISEGGGVERMELSGELQGQLTHARRGMIRWFSHGPLPKCARPVPAKGSSAEAV